jgi:ADP-heptose:LPS heptosyltransferase
VIYILLTWLLAPIWWPIAQLRKLGASTPRKILIAEIAGIGDVVCSASLFQALRDRYPHATIDLLVDPIAQGLAPLLPMVDRVRIFAYAEQKGLKGRLKLAKVAAGYDTAICLIPSAAQLTGACWGAVPRRLSVLPGNLNTSYRLLAPLLTTTCRHKDGHYFPGTQFELCATLLPSDGSRQKYLVTTAGAAAMQLPTNKHWVGLLVSSGRALKRLSEAQLVALATGALNLGNNKTGVVLLGGPGDRDQAQTVMTLLGGVQGGDAVVNTVGQYELAQLPGILRQLSVLVGVDSGVTHMADALNVPVVCIAGPVNLQEVYQSGAGRVLLECGLDCHPCSTVFKTPNQCMRKDRACLQKLDMSQVVTHVQHLLGKRAVPHA